MVPPFLAYYGVMTKNKSAVAESYNQIRLYRQYLRDESADNLWKHMAFGTNQDMDHWSTGTLQPIYLLVCFILIKFFFTLYRQWLGSCGYDPRPRHYQKLPVRWKLQERAERPHWLGD